MSNTEREDHLPDAEFEAAEDRLDKMDYSATTHDDSPDGFARWQRASAHRTRIASLGAVLVAAVVIALLVTHSGQAPRPSCSPHSSGCRQSSDGQWLPHWYYSALVAAQSTPNRQRPLSTGTQPTFAELTKAGATSSEVGLAQRYANRIGQGTVANYTPLGSP
jgi:hypothetical protein